jgi:hypothetical protein
MCRPVGYCTDAAVVREIKVRAADAVLNPLASAIFSDEMSKARAEYNALGDSPGDPPYRAQAPALDAMRARVTAHAKAQKWP